MNHLVALDRIESSFHCPYLYPTPITHLVTVALDHCLLSLSVARSRGLLLHPIALTISRPFAISFSFPSPSPCPVRSPLKSRIPSPRPHAPFPFRRSPFQIALVISSPIALFSSLSSLPSSLSVALTFSLTFPSSWCSHHPFHHPSSLPCPPAALAVPAPRIPSSSLPSTPFAPLVATPFPPPSLSTNLPSRHPSSLPIAIVLSVHITFSYYSTSFIFPIPYPVTFLSLKSKGTFSSQLC
ncbi:unnamed protein product [Closterium sp. NIES-64]|nr:unnamed protein product [Closterium sp. NIES-64]